MHYRKAAIEDIPELARIRKMQLHDEGPQPEEMMDEIRKKPPEEISKRIDELIDMIFGGAADDTD